MLPRLKLHGLRHTWATLALEEGIDIHVVSDRLDHSSTHITSQIYTHVTRPMQSDAADRLAARILGSDLPGTEMTHVAGELPSVGYPASSRSQSTQIDDPERKAL